MGVVFIDGFLPTILLHMLPPALIETNERGNFVFKVHVQGT